ncbi:hypothetical protein N658DRAFT_309417 [Parathielavia hyrcaniae]|uniref:Uncharacterized protein n=1 Tax=Parathielavia hyrcaniae TaxID=113614 RepID=A0AAN6Q4B2_9PEZI|nr:hypothetical protein N658DRAFT_309417 [Parathielavia hyrcaniae]
MKTVSDLEPIQDRDALDTALGDAVRLGDVDEIRRLLRQGANPNSLHWNSWESVEPPLVMAARNGYFDIVDLLLEHGADIDLSASTGRPPLIAAALNAQSGMVARLISRGASLSNASQWLEDRRVARLPGPSYPLHGHAASRPFQELVSFPTPFLASSYPAEVLDNAILMATQLDIVDAYIDSIVWEWEVPSAIQSQPWDWGFQNAVIVMHNQLHYTPEPQRPENFLAMTWGEWLANYIPLPSLQGAVIDFLAVLLAKASEVTGGERGSRPSQDSELAVPGSLSNSWFRGNDLGRITLGQHSLCIKFPQRPPFSRLRLFPILDALEWLCLTIRPPREDNQIDLSTAKYRLERYEDRLDTVRSHTGKRPTMTLATMPLCETEHGCWRNLFEFCNIVQLSPFMLSPPSLLEFGSRTVIPLGSNHGDEMGYGLEMSFDLMVSLAAVKYPLVINGGVVLIGYESALVPLTISDRGDAAQFHLVVHNGDENTLFNPYKADLGQRLLTLDAKQFRSMRCFLGWCPAAQLNLGTRHLPALVQYSRARETSKSAFLDGFETLIQLGLNPAGPFSATLGVQANYKYISHRRHFTPFKGYCNLLRDTAAKTVAVYDVAKRRGWLVPMLSFLLHMAHAFVLDSPDAPPDNVPSVDGHADAAELIPLLEHLGEQPVYGNMQANMNGRAAGAPDHNLLFRQLLLGLRTNLLSTIEATKLSAHNTLHGFEFMDVVTAPDRGACIRLWRFPLRPRRGSPSSTPLTRSSSAPILAR